MKLSLFLSLLFLISCATKQVKISKIEKRAEIYYNQGTQELVSKNYTLALKHLMEANILKPDDSRILNNLGMAYYFKKKHNRAVGYVKRSIKIDPKNTKARLNLATIYMALSKYNEAKNQYDIVLDDLTYEGQYRTYYNIGLLYMKQGKDTEAVNYFKQSIAENSSFCASHFLLGELYFKNRNFEKALASFKASGYGTCYNNPKPIYHQALSYIKLKQYDTAKLKLEEIIERFSPSEYEQKASKKIDKINLLSKRIEEGSSSRYSKKRNILTPDF
ncbi:MAG: tetratricopeptide (TPR) repeat protein [Bacteriovoracaceae bacterium]|jgi:type IV pilus assembly protein PilF